MKRTTSTMPSKKAIRDYWEKKNPDMFYKNSNWALHDDNVYDDWVHFNKKPKDELFCCFACGFEKTIERAHILAHSSGGSDDLENIHLLCHSCHLQTEGIVRKNDDLSRMIYDEYIMTKEHYRQHFKRSSETATKVFIKSKTESEMTKYMEKMFLDLGYTKTQAKNWSNPKRYKK